MIIIFPGLDQDSVSMTMTQLENRYLETNNPIYPMYAFRHCFQRKITPPEWVLQFVALSFHDYLTNYATKEIDECFQLRVGKGQTKPMKQFLLDERDDNIMTHMFKLVEYLNISVDDAAHMVKEKLIDSDWNKTSMELTELSENSIKDIYRKLFRKDFKNLKETNPESVEYFSIDKRKAFLATFPKHSLPLGLK